MADNGAGPAAPQSRWPRRIRLVLAATVLGFCGFFLWRTLGHEGFRQLPGHLAAADPLLLGLAAAVNLGRYALWATRWRGILAGVRRARWWASFSALMSSIFLNTVVPGARPLGGIVRARLLSRSTGGPAGPVYAATLVDQLGYSLVSVALGLTFLPRALVPAGKGDGRSLLQGVAVAVAVVMLAALLQPRVRGWLRRRLGERLTPAARTVEGAVQAVPRLLSRPATWIWTGTCGPVVWLANALTLWLAGRALGAPFGPDEAAAAWALGSLAGAATGTPGGIGATEAFGSTVLVAGGLPAPLALAAMLLGRSLHYISALVIGGPLLFLHRRATREGADVPPQ